MQVYITLFLEEVGGVIRAGDMVWWILMDDLQFYVLFNSILVMSGPWVSDFERACAVGPCLWFRRFSLKQGSNLELLDQ